MPKGWLGWHKGEVVDDFRCVSGWVIPDQRWEGVPLASLLDDARPLPEARYVGFTSGGYTVGLTVEEAREGGLLVALRHNGAPLTAEHGGPCRLVVQGREGRWSVKWLERIELLPEPPVDTGHHSTSGYSSSSREGRVRAGVNSPTASLLF